MKSIDQKKFYEFEWGRALKNPMAELGTFLSLKLRSENRMFLAFLHRQGIGRGRLLDLGCGRGVAANYFARNGIGVTGIDFSYNAIRLARENSRSLDNCQFIIGDVLKINFSPDSFDIVNDSGCFHHFRTAERRKYLTNVKNALKSGGYYKLYCFSRETKQYQSYHHGQPRPWILYQGQHYTHFFAISEIKKIFSEDFEILRIGKLVGFNKERKFWLLFMRKK